MQASQYVGEKGQRSNALNEDHRVVWKITDALTTGRVFQLNERHAD